jgi:hypothetical protein
MNIEQYQKHNKAFKRNKNSGLRFASLHILTHYFCPLNAALALNRGFTFCALFSNRYSIFFSQPDFIIGVAPNR